MSDWSSGYVSDIEYTTAYYQEQVPSILQLACLLNQVETGGLDRGYNYCELGCGFGHTLLVLAASNPHSRFVGVDFNPVHILQARALADAAGLANVEFLECSFDDLLGERGRTLPQFDYITLHGVYSWVSQATRESIVRILNQFLNPGGLVYISYNAMPGVAKCLPVQRLLYELARIVPDRSDRRVAHAIEIVRRLAATQANALVDNGFVNEILKTHGRKSIHYLAHEYLNENWHPLYHIDVARDLAAAKLAYAGSADVIENFPETKVSADQNRLLAEIGVPALEETLRDMCANTVFRRDVFVRGQLRMSPERQRQLMNRVRLALCVPRSAFKLEFKLRSGTANLSAEVYGPIVDALADRPRTVAELLDLPAVRDRSKLTASEILAVLVGTGQALPMRAATAEEQQSADRLNLAYAARPDGIPANARMGLAVASLGGGLRTDFLEMLGYGRFGADGGLDAEALVEFAAAAIAGRGEHVVDLDRDKQVDGAEAREVLRKRVRRITDEMVPLWQRLTREFTTAGADRSVQ